MEGIDKIKEKILEEAYLQVRSNIEKAKEEADVIIKNAEEKAAAKKNHEVEKARIEAENRKNRLIASANLETRKMKLKAKQDMIDEAFSKAIERLSTLPKDQYRDMLSQMIVNRIETGTEEIILPEKHKAELVEEIINIVNKKLKEKNIKGSVSLSDEKRNIVSGFIVKAGNVEINNSFESIVKMERDNLEAEVVKILFTEVS
jgi:V/A-type H+-transporting ATPase subunit E